jgi:hypothetical protein
VNRGLHEEGIKEEAQGDDRYGAKDYEGAYHKYRAAKQAFQKLYDLYLGSLSQEAEKARASMLKVKTEADKAEASTLARGDYSVAKKFEEDGESYFREKNYSQAKTNFAAAEDNYKKAFEAAKELARSPERLAAQRAQRLMLRSKKKAEGSPTKRQPFYNWAKKAEEQAEKAMKRGAFSDARKFFTDAKNFYDRASGK